MNENKAIEPVNFIRRIIDEDIKNNKNDGRVLTRFPPEPNGYLHIGHAKSICINFGIAADYKSHCNLRFDDTNPSKEETEYINSIQEDIKWLGFDWGENLFYASDYFDKLYEYAVKLIKKGKAYVCDLQSEEIREYRGTLTKPGKESPFRSRSIAENLELFEQMKTGQFKEGEKTLRANIDMSSPNLNMRDPVLYRILYVDHPRTGDKWCIYPMYDWAHGQSDSIEQITHSICTLEFEAHRPLYDWFIRELEIFHPQQIEFARLNISYTVMSKRKLNQLVTEKHVNSWDDPRMPTLAGMRRRGVPPQSIRDFCGSVGVAKADSIVDYAQFEFSIRNVLNQTAQRVMAVLDPVKLIITNYPENQEEIFDVINNPEDESTGTRKVPFSRELYIERNDFLEEAPRKYFRLSPGKEVRLAQAYYITCTDFKKNSDTGFIEEIYCTFDPTTKGGWSEDGRKVKGTLHWVSIKHAVPIEVRIYDRLFTNENPDQAPEGKTFIDNINSDSLKINNKCFAEPYLKDADKNIRFQFLRQGYFYADKDSTPEKPVFNLTVSLKDSWAGKIKKINPEANKA